MKRLRWYDNIALNIFWLGLNIRNTALGSIFMPYLVGIFAPEAIKNSALGGMRAAGLVIAMLVQPAAGLLSDRSTSRFGRRRPYIFVGAIFDLVFLAVIALAHDYWTLLIGVLLIQFSSNISHGPLQALIPDLVPEDQRGSASAVKSLMELIPLVLVGLTIAMLVGAGQFGWAVFATGASLLMVTIITMLTVKETPLTEKPTTPFWPPMLRVLGMLAGLLVGGLAGLVGGGLIGGLAGLVTFAFADKATALALTVGVGGATSMVFAVVAGVWAGTLFTLGQDTRKQNSFMGGLLGGLTGLITLIIADKTTTLALGTGVGSAVLKIVAVIVGIWVGTLLTLGQDTPQQASFVKWIVNRLTFILIGALLGLVSSGLIGGLAWLLIFSFTDKVTALAVSICLGGATAILVTVIVSAWGWTLSTFRKDTRKQSSFTWWIVNRLMFLAAATSIQGSVMYFVKFAFNLTDEAAASLTGTLTGIIGIFILASALASNWIADRVGHRRLVGLSGLVAAVGGFILLGTIWVPNLPLVYVAGTFIGVATGFFMTSNWALGTELVPASEAGRYLGVSNLAGAGAGIVGAGIGGLVADYLNGFHPGLGYFAIFASYAVLFALSAVSLMGVRKQ